MYNTPLTGRGSPDFMEELAFGLDLTLYEGSDSPFDGLARLDSSTAKTEIARPARAIKALEPNPRSGSLRGVSLVIGRKRVLGESEINLDFILNLIKNEFLYTEALKVSHVG